MRIRITTSGCAGTFVLAALRPCVLAALVAGTAGCAASQSEVQRARSSAYDADFAVVYSETLAAVRALYPTMQENPAEGVMRTSWHEVRLSNTGAGTPYQRDFVRFDVRVVDRRPWRVRVSGEAARWDFESAMPAPLAGGDEPPWLRGRIEALQLAIHRRLASHAVVVEQAPEASAAAGSSSAPAVDPARFGDIPPAAGQAVARVMAALEAGDLDAMGRAMHEDFTWSLGAAPSARHALLVWRADDGALAALKAALEVGCQAVAGAGKSDEQVVCPPQAAEPGFAGPRAGFTPGPDGGWKMQAFLTGN